MLTRLHEEKLIATYSKNQGKLRRVLVSSGNQACAILTSFGSKRRIYFNSKLCYEGPRANMHLANISFDGSKIATTQQLDSSFILVNGERTYETESDIVGLFWLSNNELAWSCWDGRGGRNSTRYFINGKDVSDSTIFEPTFNLKGEPVLLVEESGETYFIDEYGNRSKQDLPLEDNSLQENFLDSNDLELPEIKVDKNRKKVRILFKGEVGPEFDILQPVNGMYGTHIFNSDYSKIAYVGCNYSRMARRIDNIADKLFRKADDFQDQKNRDPLWIWPLALLFNSDFGPVERYIRNSSRCFPVNNLVVWPNGYWIVSSLFFTPIDELVATVYKRKSACVVIDEEEGPSFDFVLYAKYLKNQGITYIGKRRDNIYGVTVKFVSVKDSEIISR